MLLYPEKDDIGMRIDLFISSRMDDLSRSRIQKYIKEGLVKSNGTICKANYRINNKDIIDIVIPKQPQDSNIMPENLPLDIIYEDNDILIINKPKNMVVHPAPGHYSGTVVNAVMYHCKDSLSGINGVMRPGIVHRIDKDTTGSLIICKNDESHNKIAIQIAEHTVTRVYRGIVIGGFKESEGSIDAPIGRNPKERKKMAINIEGRHAVTHWKVLSSNNGYSYMEFRLETGRTHQIRVHMTSIGHPLLGDDVYGPSKQPYKLDGQTLHAMTIGFIHPSTNEYVEFNAPMPEYFNNMLKKLGLDE